MPSGRSNLVVRSRGILTAVPVLLAIAGQADAAWLGYKNDTPAVIAVQTSVTANGRVIRGKVHLLYPGEMAWDNIAAPGPRTISVFDPKAKNRLVTQETIFLQNQDLYLSAQMRAVPQVPGKTPQPPAIRLIPAKPPGPPGVIPPRPNQPATPPPPPPAGGTVVPPRGPLPPTAQPKPPTESPKKPSPPPGDAAKSKSG